MSIVLIDVSRFLVGFANEQLKFCMWCGETLEEVDGVWWHIISRAHNQNLKKWLDGEMMELELSKLDVS